jgi:hypothetical protein
VFVDIVLVVSVLRYKEALIFIKFALLKNMAIIYAGMFSGCLLQLLNVKLNVHYFTTGMCTVLLNRSMFRYESQNFSSQACH